MVYCFVDIAEQLTMPDIMIDSYQYTYFYRSCPSPNSIQYGQKNPTLRSTEVHGICYRVIQMIQ